MTKEAKKEEKKRKRLVRYCWKSQQEVPVVCWLDRWLVLALWGKMRCYMLCFFCWNTVGGSLVGRSSDLTSAVGYAAEIPLGSVSQSQPFTCFNDSISTVGFPSDLGFYKAHFGLVRAFISPFFIPPTVGFSLSLSSLKVNFKLSL